MITLGSEKEVIDLFKNFNIKKHIEPRNLGNRVGTEIAIITNYNIESKLSESPPFLTDFNDSEIIKDFISIVGSSVENTDYNDIDFVIRMKDPTDYLKRAIETRLQKEYIGEKKLHFIWGDPEGPHDTHIPLYDLQLKKLEPKIVKMEEIGFIPLKPFQPMKPNKKFYSIEDTVKFMYGD